MSEFICDLCGEDADFVLCHKHLEDFRWPDIYSTKDGDYPIGADMVLWQEDGCDTWIGGYNPESGRWWAQGDENYVSGEKLSDPQNGEIFWCYLESLKSKYRFMINTPEAGDE